MPQFRLDQLDLRWTGTDGTTPPGHVIAVGYDPLDNLRTFLWADDEPSDDTYCGSLLMREHGPTVAYGPRGGYVTSTGDQTTQLDLLAHEHAERATNESWSHTVTDTIPDAARDAARDTAVAKLNSIYSGQIPESVAREIADAALNAARPAIAEHFAQLLLDRNPDRDADFSASVDWAADTIRQAGAKEELPTRCICGDTSGIPHPHPTWKDPSPRVLPARPFGEES